MVNQNMSLRFVINVLKRKGACIIIDHCATNDPKPSSRITKHFDITQFLAVRSLEVVLAQDLS